MRNLAKLLLARGIAVSGSDLKDSKGLAELRELGADVGVGHDAAHVRDPTPMPWSSRARSAIGTWSWSRRAVVAIPVWARAAGARRADGGYALDRGGGHARQDHDDLDGGGRPRARRARSELPDRRRPERERERRALGDGRPVRLRSGRERRLVPAGVASDRHRDERRRRSRRLLSGRARRDRGGVRGVHDAMRERGRVRRRRRRPIASSIARTWRPSTYGTGSDNEWTLAIDAVGPERGARCR